MFTRVAFVKNEIVLEFGEIPQVFEVMSHELNYVAAAGNQGM